jgi:uncharacterized protein (DUF2062 family)
MTLVSLRRRLRALLHLEDPPWRIALALAVGVFISCTPFYFFQTLLALLVATLFRLNKVATVAGTWLNLPWFAPFVYAASLRVGTLIVPDRDATSGEALVILLRQPGDVSWNEAAELLRSVSAALLVGTTIVGVLAAAATYVVALRLIRARRSDGSGNTGAPTSRAA